MARKAKLDILEIHNDEQPADLEALQLPELEPEGQQPRLVRLQLRKKLIVLCVILTSVCIIAGGGVFFWMKVGKNNTVSLSDKLRPVAVTDVMQHNVANLDNFVIDYRGQGDTIRIAIFALAVELNEPVKKDVVEKQVGLRGDIYTLSKKRSLGSLFSPEGRGTLRSEIAAELDKRLGAGVVKAVYFTKFYIL
jgi:flagellar basal body-associated protein FliL